MKRRFHHRGGREHRLALLALCGLVTLGALAREAAAGDRVSDLARTLTQSKHERARIAAAVALGRLEDPRALGPLVRALDDSSESVRALAATALGRLKDPRALPALRRAARDPSDSVRQRAAAAIRRIRAESPAPAASPAARARPARYALTPREAPRRVLRPQLFLTVKSSADRSPGSAQARLRRRRADHLQELMVRELERESAVTLEPAVAGELGIDAFTIDLAISKLTRQVSGPFVEVECEIRIAISNGRGQMLSFLTGGAKVQVPAASFRRNLEPRLQREALEGAVKSLRRDLVAYLLRNPG